MTKPSRITITNSSSIIGFEKSGGGNWLVWDRYLTIENKRAYHIGNVCGTCAFFFERLEGANRSISAAAIAERLNTGTDIAEERIHFYSEPNPPKWSLLCQFPNSTSTPDCTRSS